MGRDVLIQSVESGRSNEESMGLSQTGSTGGEQMLTRRFVRLESDATSIAYAPSRDDARELVASSLTLVSRDLDLEW